MACEESFISTLGVAPGNFFQDVDHAFEEFVTGMLSNELCYKSKFI